MPLLSTATGSFFAGRRANAFGRLWDPSLDLTPAFWIDASDTSSYTVSGTDMTAITDKAGNATITVGGTPRVMVDLNGKNTFTFQQNNNEDLTTNEFLQAASGNHWAVGVFQWNNLDDTKDSFWSVENNTVNAVTNKRDYAGSRSGGSGFSGELDLDSLSSNRISSTAGNSISWDNSLTQDYWYIISVIFNKTGNQIRCRVSGGDNFTPVNDYDNSLTPNLDVRIMRNRSNERMSGKVAEFFTVADVPGTGGTDISTVEKAEGYLAHKWDNGNDFQHPGGLLHRMHTDHPYKSVAPTG